MRPAGTAADIEQGKRRAEFLAAVYQCNRVLPHTIPAGGLRLLHHVIVPESIAVIASVAQKVRCHEMLAANLKRLIKPVSDNIVPVMPHSVRVYVRPAHAHGTLHRHLSGAAAD